MPAQPEKVIFGSRLHFVQAKWSKMISACFGNSLIPAEPLKASTENPYISKKEKQSKTKRYDKSNNLCQFQ